MKQSDSVISPVVFTLTATNVVDPSRSVVEQFWRSTYAHDTDGFLEASAFSEKMFDAGFFVEYSEIEDIERA